MMYISVCDDEPKIADDIAAIVGGVMQDAKVETFHSGKALMEGFFDREPDVLFLDIDMPDVSGLEIAGRLGEDYKKTLLVFVTAHDELVYDSLRYHPFAFVRKKYLERELAQVLEDCAKQLASRDKKFHFRADGKEIAVLLSDIRYFEADGNYLVIFLENGDRYRLRSTMTVAEDALAADGFIRIHKGFLVNQSHVRIMGQEQVELASGEILPIGRQYARDAKQEILKYMRE